MKQKYLLYVVVLLCTDGVKCTFASFFTVCWLHRQQHKVAIHIECAHQGLTKRDVCSESGTVDGIEVAHARRVSRLPSRIVLIFLQQHMISAGVACA